MEKVMSVEERIRRAEEIYERRKQGSPRQVATVNIQKKKDIKLLKKMIIQILVCVAIYSIIYIIQNSNYIFSADFMKKVNEILSYDTNFGEIYENTKNQIINLLPQNEESNQEAIGGSEEESQEQLEQQTEEQAEQPAEQKEVNNQEVTQEPPQEVQQLSQEEQDIINVKNTCSFIKPAEGNISSVYGYRETATGNVPKNHTGTDIAANTGTKIKAATDGEVVLSSEEGDYRKTFKNTNRRSEYNLCTLQ